MSKIHRIIQTSCFGLLLAACVAHETRPNEQAQNSVVVFPPEGAEKASSLIAANQLSGDFCDTGYLEYRDNQKYCCRGYRADSNNWSGYTGTQCCPEGTSVNGQGECIACGVGKYYNMGYADLQNKKVGTQACGQRCTTNKDCPEDRFCYMDAHATQADTNIDPIVGTCVSADDVGGVVSIRISLNGGSPDYWIGAKNMMDWWSARNFCMRYGNVDLPTRRQICTYDVPAGESCPSPLRKALEQHLGAQQQGPHFWLEETGTGKAYYVDPNNWGYKVKVPPEMTARARSAGVICGPISTKPAILR